MVGYARQAVLANPQNSNKVVVVPKEDQMNLGVRMVFVVRVCEIFCCELECVPLGE